jgi:hypothetical protein
VVGVVAGWFWIWIVAAAGGAEAWDATDVAGIGAAVVAGGAAFGADAGPGTVDEADRAVGAIATVPVIIVCAVAPAVAGGADAVPAAAGCTDAAVDGAAGEVFAEGRVLAGCDGRAVEYSGAGATDEVADAGAAAAG